MGQNLGDKIDRLYDINAEIDELKSRLSDLNKDKDALEYQILQDMENIGVDKVRGSKGTASMKVDLYPQVKDMEALVNWASETGNTAILQKRVSSGVFKEYFEQNGEYPPGIEAYNKSTLNFRRQK